MDIELMDRGKMQKGQLHFLGLTFFSVCILFLLIWYFLTFEHFPGHLQSNSWLLERLVRIKSLPDDFINSNSHSIGVIYVLGGSQASLTHRFRTAVGLYQKNAARKICVLSRPGITEYDPSLGRNLTNDEWAVKMLVSLGVPNRDIEFVAMEKGLCGTMSEAKGISEIAIRRGYSQMILVTSQYHTARTWLSFSKKFETRNVRVYIYASDEMVGLGSLLYEYLKLVLYSTLC